MLTCGGSKFKLVGSIGLCLILWKLLHHISNLNSVERSSFNNRTELSKSSGNQVLVTVYYEALCSDSRNFILKQLIPAYEKAANLIDIDFVPYGKATTTEEDGSYKFECQHSYIECEANKIHACVLHQALGKKLHLKYVACMIKDNMIPHQVGRKCAEELGVEYGPVEECANGQLGSLLLRDYGLRTHALSPKITFVPTVQLNKSSQVPLVHILKDLFAEICKMFGSEKPSECS